MLKIRIRKTTKPCIRKICISDGTQTVILFASEDRILKVRIMEALHDGN